MPVRFRKQMIADMHYESAGVFDVNNDGIPDIVSGEYWYEGPDWTSPKSIHRVAKIQDIDEYWGDFSTIPMDVNGDGHLDFISGAWWGQTLRWYENPAGKDGEWQVHDIAVTGCIETTRAWDVDGDGALEIVPNTPGSPLSIYKLITDANGKGYR